MQRQDLGYGGDTASALFDDKLGGGTRCLDQGGRAGFEGDTAAASVLKDWQNR
jgi:hypothetical protein